MKKAIYILCINLLLTTTLQAQPTGQGSSASTQAGIDNGWQNWAFAGSAIVTATAGVLALAFNNGHAVHAH